jgi:hypothetical protein
MELKLERVFELTKNAKLNERYNFDPTGNLRTAFTVTEVRSDSIVVHFVKGGHGKIDWDVVAYRQPLSSLEKELL